MRKRLNLVGQRFNKLLVIKFTGVDKFGHSKFLCKCDCGNEKIISGTALKDAGRLSCGCIQITHRWSKGQNLKIKSKELKFYHKYQHIKDRCNNPKNPAFKNYGGRGIKFLWNSFEEFRDDMFATFREGLSIERINNNGNYCKENCRWATAKEQLRNTRVNRIIDFDGEKLCLTDWSNKLKIPKNTILNRFNRGWSVERALNPIRRRNQWK